MCKQITHPKWITRSECNKAVRQRSYLLFIETSFLFEESPCAVRTNTAGLCRLCTLFVLSTLLVFEHMHAVLSSILVLCCTMVTTKLWVTLGRPTQIGRKTFFDPIFETALGLSQSRTMGECLQTGRLYGCLYQEGHLHVFIDFYRWYCVQPCALQFIYCMVKYMVKWCRYLHLHLNTTCWCCLQITLLFFYIFMLFGK